MGYELTIDQPSPEISIHGLGTFENGTHHITDEQAENFRLVNARTELVEGGSRVHVLGPTLEEAAVTMHGVSVVPSKRPVEPVKPGTGAPATPEGSDK